MSIHNDILENNPQIFSFVGILLFNSAVFYQLIYKLILFLILSMIIEVQCLMFQKKLEGLKSFCNLFPVVFCTTRVLYIEPNAPVCQCNVYVA